MGPRNFPRDGGKSSWSQRWLRPRRRMSPKETTHEGKMGHRNQAQASRDLPRLTETAPSPWARGTGGRRPLRQLPPCSGIWRASGLAGRQAGPARGQVGGRQWRCEPCRRRPPALGLPSRERPRAAASLAGVPWGEPSHQTFPCPLSPLRKRSQLWQ